MPISALLTHLLIAACTLLAWALVRGWRSPRWPFYRPLAILLSWSVVADVARALLAPPLRVPAPYPWPVRALWIVDLGLVLAWPFAIVAACFVIFARRPWWPAAAAWFACWAALGALYPTVRGRPLLLTEAAIATACWAACAWTAWRCFRAGDVWIASHMSLVPILGAQAGMLASVGWWPNPTRDWWIARVVQGAGYVVLLTYQVRQLWRYRARTR